MGKPSIFSRDYEKKMRRRRIGVVLGVIGIIALCVVLYLFVSRNLKQKFTDTDKKNKIIKEHSYDLKKSIEHKASNKKEDKKSQVDIKPKETGYDLTLSDGEKIKVIYEIENNEKKFKYIHPLESKVKYDISPDFKKFVVYDNKSQRIILLNIEGNQTDITNNKYVSTSGSVVIEHDQLLKNKPDYIWCAEPKFIDNNSIVYISQLPWLNKTNKYVWITNLVNNTNVCVQSIQGQEISFGKITEKGIPVTVDGNVMYLNGNGEIVN